MNLHAGLLFPERHLKTLERYIEVAGSDDAFQDTRYWELTQSLDDILLRQTYLSLHIELLQGLSEILLASDQPVKTVVHRVERAVKDAMWSTPDLSWSPGTAKERSVHSYMEWRQGFNTWSEALADAFKKGFNIGDDFMAVLALNAYRLSIK